MAENSNWFTGREVVLVLDEPSETDRYLDLIRFFPEIRWTILENDREHVWRNPSKVINVGIRHATGEHVLVMSPETICVGDLPSSLLQVAKTGVAAVGGTTFVTYSELKELGLKAASALRIQYLCGSICVRRLALVAVRGYDEGINGWGGDDYNLRSRLNLIGYPAQYVGGPFGVHPGRADPIRTDLPKARTREIEQFANGFDWGTEFSKVVHRS